MSAFEKSTSTWSILEEGGRFTIQAQRLSPKGGWEDDPGRVESLPPGSSLDDVALRVAEIVAG